MALGILYLGYGRLEAMIGKFNWNWLQVLLVQLQFSGGRLGSVAVPSLPAFNHGQPLLLPTNSLPLDFGCQAEPQGKEADQHTVEEARR